MIRGIKITGHTFMEEKENITYRSSDVEDLIYEGSRLSSKQSGGNRRYQE